MKICPHCYTPSDPTWDHKDDCPYWPGSEWARRHGWMEDCGGLVDCDVVHEYEVFEMCGCEGKCHYCSHIGCERCMEKAYRDLPWWRRLFKAQVIVTRH